MLGYRLSVLSFATCGFFSAIMALPVAQAQDATVAYLSGNLPECMGRSGAIGVINSQVADWEDSTANGFLARAHVRGPIIDLFEDQTGHNHFGVQIGATPEIAVEVIYSQDFGDLPDLQLGMIVEACGDYITSTEATQRYPASPDRGILHWVHRSDSRNHESGYVAVNGVVYGD